MNAKLCMLTNATQVNKLKQELQSYGFNNSVLKQLNKSELVKLQNSFVKRFESLRHTTKDLVGLRIIVANDLMKEL